MSTPIVIASIPKYITIKAGRATSSPQIDEMSDSSCGNEVLDEFLVRGKKRKLDHLTWEEKLQRKKLKNRVAAQTSRDRKKAKMDDMEHTIQVQADKITALEAKCNRLVQEKSDITDKYTDLEHRFEELKQRFEAQSKAAMDAVKVTIETRSIGSSTNDLTGSAASNCNPLPKGTHPLELQSILRASRTTKDNDMAASLMNIIALCLLYKTCSKTSTLESWKSLPKVYSQMSPQSWKMVLEKAASRMPRMAAPQSDCLNQWWGPQQNSWNPAKISVAH